MKDVNWNIQAARLFCFCVYGTIIYVFLRYVFPACLPIIVAVIVGAAVFCIADKCSKYSHIPHGLCAVALLCGIVTVFGALGAYLCRYLLIQIRRVSSEISYSDIEEIFARAKEIPMFREICAFAFRGEHSAEELVAKALTGVLSFASQLIAGALGETLRATPTALVTGAVSVIVCCYIAVDMRRICASCLEFFPQRMGIWIKRMGKRVGALLKKIIGAYSKIYALTFAEVFVGLSFLCPRFALIGAFAIATVDILPIFGAGIVLIPWGVAELLMEKYFLGIGLLALYVIVTIVRQIVEPRLLGSAVGISPFAALIAMFAGYRALGVLGMLVLPAALSVFKKIRADTLES